MGSERRAPVVRCGARHRLVDRPVARRPVRHAAVADDRIRAVWTRRRGAERLSHAVARYGDVFAGGAEILTMSNEALPMLIRPNGVPGSNSHTVPARCRGKSLMALPIAIQTSPAPASTNTVGPSCGAAGARSSPPRSTRL